MCEIMKGIIGGALLYMAVYDLRKKVIPLYMILVIGIITILHTILCRSLPLAQLLFGLGIGIFFLVFSKITREAVGYGDSLVLLCLGMFLGGSLLSKMIMVATLGSSLFAIVVGIVKGWNRKLTLPFIPFVCASYVGVVWI